MRKLTELRGWYDRLKTQSGLDALLVIPVSKPRRVVPQQTTVLDGGVEEKELSVRAHRTCPVRHRPIIHNYHRSIGAHFER